MKGVLVMNMKKKGIILFILSLVILTVSACAEILPPRGEGQIGLQAAILCQNLTVRQAPGDDAGIIDQLHYGDFIIVTSQTDGFAEICTSDSEDALRGWVNADYIAIDPSWFKADAATPVYAWNDTTAPKVGLLDQGTTLPVLKDEDGWIIVSLRGATGWIRK